MNHFRIGTTTTVVVTPGTGVITPRLGLHEIAVHNDPVNLQISVGTGVIYQTYPHLTAQWRVKCVIKIKRWHIPGLHDSATNGELC